MKKNPALKLNKSVKKSSFSVFSVIICLFLALYSLILIGLFVWALRTSFLPYNYDDLFENYSPWGFSSEFHPENYLYVLKYLGITKFQSAVPQFIGEALGYSVGYALISSFLQTLCTATVAYLTAKYDNKFSRFFHNVVLFTLVLPIAGSAASLYSLVNGLGIFDTWLAPVFMKFAFTNMYYLVFYAGFKRLSWSYAESAFIDGAGHFYVFFRIMLPLVLGLFGTVMLLYFIEFWNDYSFPMLYMPSYPTTSVMLQKGFLGNSSILVDFTAVDGQHIYNYYLFNNFTMQIAASLAMCVPILILYIIFSKKLTGNLTEGGIKE